MRHPYEKFMRIELIAIACVVLFGVIALIQGFLIFILLCFYLLALSIFCDAMILLYLHNPPQAGKQFLRAVMVFIFTTYLFFHL
ncbi:hypothetical protein [Virgibacillus ainsalahensis]